jgi:hypothetical protein
MNQPIGTITKFYRISGFVFDSISNNTGVIRWDATCGPPACDATLTQVRIDHNAFNLLPGGVAIFLGDGGSATYIYGVVDHNAVNSLGSVQLLFMVGRLDNSPPVPSPQGTSSNLFIEDNAINITTMTNSGQGCVDGWANNNWVIRHNNSLNCLWTSHGEKHNGGPQNIEFYDNSIKVDSGSIRQNERDCYRCFHHQGSGEFITFNNSFSSFIGESKTPMDLGEYRAFPNTIDVTNSPLGAQCDGSQAIDGNRAPTSSNHGYPCFRQPGRDTNGTLVPIYVWNNFWSNTRDPIVLNLDDFGLAPDYFANHMQLNRDAYNAVSGSAQTSPTSPFDGTTGMGFGTLANRPVTCTTGAETGGGVGYFATDQGPQGTLYRCSATNTWTIQYQPYTYPHPLVTSDPTSVAAPTNVIAVVN